jgi:hypothetical protein
MELDDSVEERLREAYSGAISKDPDRISRALEGISPQETATLVDLGLYVFGYIFNEKYQHSLTDDNVRELADKIVARESDWTEAGDADTIGRFVEAAVTGDSTRVGLGAADLTRLVIVCGGHLLAYHRPDGQRWYEYLDEIWAPFNPCYDTTIGRPDGPEIDRTVAAAMPGYPPTPATGPQPFSRGEGQAIDSHRDWQSIASYAPSRLVADVATALPTWGFEVRLNVSDVVQAHQSAWNLLTIFGLRSGSDDCPCLACGGAELQLSALDFEAAAEPQLTGLPAAAPDIPTETGAGTRRWDRHLKDLLPPAPYPPSRLVCEVMMILIQRGFEVSLHSKDLVQAHQSARILLSTFGRVPDTDGCPCQSCGGPAIHLTEYNFVADDDPALTGLPGLTAPGGLAENPPDSSAMNGDPGGEDGPPDTTPPVAEEPKEEQS